MRWILVAFAVGLAAPVSGSLAGCHPCPELESCSSGEPVCNRRAERFVVDGSERTFSCAYVEAEITVGHGRTNGWLRNSPGGDWPHFTLAFEGATGQLPDSFPLGDETWGDGPLPRYGAWLWYHDESGTEFAESGTATLGTTPDGVTIDFEGTVADREGVVRPFQARVESELYVVCGYQGCGGEPCSDADRQICERFEALASFPP